MSQLRQWCMVLTSLIVLSVSSIASAAVPLPSLLACSATKPCVSVTGNWLTVDDKTHQPRGVVHLYTKVVGGQSTVVGVSKYGFYTPGREWSKTYRGSYKPYFGKQNGTFLIMWGYLNQGDGSWGKGHVVDIDGGKVYKSHLQLQDHGNHLKVSGCIAFFCRSQKWTRLTDSQYHKYEHLAQLQEVKHPKSP